MNNRFMTLLIFLIMAITLSAQTVTFNSSDTTLNRSFQWAKKMALSYSHTNDPVGEWYEASLPNREAFCMRDVAHQTTGAAVLGLYSQNKNMLKKFAANISESRNWCSYWEINKYNKPAPVDYKNDNDFWYNLTANFDVIDAFYRMYLWTGDKDYVSAPDFTNFMDKSFTAYREAWQLTPELIAKRDRNINLYKGGSKEGNKFKNARGIPGYNEGGKGELSLGIDLLAAQSAALKDYYNVELLNGKKDAGKWLKEEKKIQKIIDEYFFDKKTNSYFSCIYTNGEKDYNIIDGNQACGHYLVYFGAEERKERISTLVDDLIKHKDKIMVESASHLPEIFFKYNRPDEALYMIKRLTSAEMKRREYPENSYSVVGAIANGLMGIVPDASANCITTASNLTSSLKWAEINNVPVFGNLLSVKHTGRAKSELTNISGPSVKWKASFKGNYQYLFVNGKKTRALKIQDVMGETISYVEVTVSPAQKMVAGIR